MTKVDLALTIERVGVRCGIGLSQLEIGFHVNVGTFLQVTKEIIRGLIEGEDMMPGSLGLWAS
jgi:hypothetical protein